MDPLCKVQRSEAFRRRVAQASDSECTRELGETAERSSGIRCFAFLAFEGVVDGKGKLASERKGEALADTVVFAVLEWRRGRRIVNADLHTRAARSGLERTSTCVADLANGDGRVSEMQLAVLDLEIVLVCWNALVNTDLGLWCTVVLDLDFEIEGCNTLQCDWDDFLAFRLARAKTVCLAGLVEASRRARMNNLLDCDGREVLLGVVISRVGQFLERVLVCACL